MAVSQMSFLRRIQERAFGPVDIASLVFFRISFGLLMFCEVLRYFAYGWIARYWIAPHFLFTYYGFSWVHPWPGIGMYFHFGILGLLAIFIAIGFAYRISTFLFALGITYCFLLEQAVYLNHLYLVCLLSFLLIFVPANRRLALDAWLHPQWRRDQVAAWTLWLFRGQMAVVYFYSGMAKLSPDWLRGEPMRTWLADRSDLPIIGRFLQEEWVVYLFSYGGLLLDLLIAPLLLWRRTRGAAFCLAVGFHLANAKLFFIGIFPWLAIAATSLFLSPDWPRRVIAITRRVPAVSESRATAAYTPQNKPVISTLIAVYFIIQLLVPLRHLLYPGNVDWTHEGHRFSWRMKLLDRDSTARFFVTDPNNGATHEVDPLDSLRPSQVRKMSARPDMILQFAQYLARTEPCSGARPLQVRAEVWLALNGREPALLVDPTIDLAAQPRTLGHVSWMLPMPQSTPTR
jgi:vitamin K-dependent gamma-carboxylase-like protein